MARQARPDEGYRPEIDGLRAVAVVAVGLFHSGLRPFGGGFVGVDVFFVVSGYLITGIILRDLEAGRFSLLAFYERRARRLLPTLIVVMAASCVVAYRWMIPYNLESFGKSMLATSLFANNLLLANQSGYWAPAAEMNPLLHTWSLGVEEQYYLTFPLMLLAGWRILGRRIWFPLLIVAVLSFGAALWASSRHPIADFYLLPTRAWELLLGSLAVRLSREPRPWMGRHGPAQALSICGVLMIAGSVVAFGRSVSAPGLHTLIPALGAVLILLFGQARTLTHRLLSSRPLVQLGLISYSLYLLHLPVLAFARIYPVEPPSPLILGGLFLATIPAAYLSWRFVEMPFRSGARFGRAFVFAASGLLTATCAGVGAWLVWTHGLPSRLDPDEAGRRAETQIAYNERAFRFRKAAFETPGALHLLVTGNSFARDTINMLVETFELRDVEIVYRDDLGPCMSGWPDAGGGALSKEADVIIVSYRQFESRCMHENIDLVRRRGQDIVFVGTKFFGSNLNWLARLDRDARRNRTNPLPDWVILSEEIMARTVPAEHYVSLMAAIMRDGQVTVTDDEGRLLSQDRTHVTPAGARYIGRKAMPNSPLGRILAAFRDRRAKAVP